MKMHVAKEMWDWDGEKSISAANYMILEEICAIVVMHNAEDGVSACMGIDHMCRGAWVGYVIMCGSLSWFLLQGKNNSYCV